MTRSLILVLAPALLVMARGAGAQQNTNQPVVNVPSRAAPAQGQAAPAGPVFVPTIPGSPAPAASDQPGTPQSGAQPIPDSAAPAGGVPPPDIAPAANVSANYQIGPTDSLAVTVWKQPNFSGAYLVRPDGIITVPLIGDVPAAGLTPAQLGADLSNRLKKYVNDPLVNVIVQAVNSKRVILVGEVVHIGPLPMTPNMTPLEAIATAGGLTPYGNARHIYILRKVNGKEQRIPFNYRKAVKNGDMQGIELQPGDTIVVP